MTEEEKDARIAELEKENEELGSRIDELQSSLDAFENWGSEAVDVLKKLLP
jgi:hypothetical protein